MMIRLTCYGIMAMRRRMLSYKRWVRNWAESLNVLATVHQLDHSSKGKTHDIIKDMLRNSLKFPELHLGSDNILKLSETIWHTHPMSNLRKCFESIPIIFIHHIWHICETSIASHESCAMVHGSWLITRALRPLPFTRPWICDWTDCGKRLRIWVRCLAFSRRTAWICINVTTLQAHAQGEPTLKPTKQQRSLICQLSIEESLLIALSYMIDCHCKYLNDLWTICISSL